MKKRNVLLFVLAALVLLCGVAAAILFGLSGGEGPTVAAAEPTKNVAVITPGSIEPQTPTPTPMPTPTPTPTPRTVSWTTGRKLTDVANPTYRPVIISVENAPGARPQVGLNMADVIYEAPAEYSITRLQLVFNDEYPCFAGPLRSSRVYFMRLQQEWKTMYIHRGYGGPAFDHHWIGVHIESYLMDTGDTQWRDPSRSDVHSLMVNVAESAQLFYGDYMPVPTERYGFSDQPDVSGGKPFERVALNFFYRRVEQENWITFVYNEETNTLSRYQDGRIFRTKTPVSGNSARNDVTEREDFYTQNLIVQYVPFTELKDEDRHRNADLHGTGRCDYFINGMHLTGFWSRPDYETDHTTYFLDNGEELTVATGRTWICIHPDDFTVSPVAITYRDGTQGAPATGDRAAMDAYALEHPAVLEIQAEY